MRATVPVTQRTERRTIAMTAPVGRRRDGDSRVVSFTTPEGETLESLPQPTDSRVVLRELPASRFAVVRFSGRWSDQRMLDRARALRAWAKSRCGSCGAARSGSHSTRSRLPRRLDALASSAKPTSNRQVGLMAGVFHGRSPRGSSGCAVLRKGRGCRARRSTASCSDWN